MPSLPVRTFAFYYHKMYPTLIPSNLKKAGVVLRGSKPCLRGHNVGTLDLWQNGSRCCNSCQPCFHAINIAISHRVSVSSFLRTRYQIFTSAVLGWILPSTSTAFSSDCDMFLSSISDTVVNGNDRI